MVESFPILLSGGVMLAAAIPRPRQVTVHWLRLAGILALCFAGLSLFFVLRRHSLADAGRFYLGTQWAILTTTIVAILGQLAAAQTLCWQTQRGLAILGFLLAVTSGVGLLHPMTNPAEMSNLHAIGLQTLACTGVSAMCGLVLMDMLLGHAYLTAAKMTIAPFRRLHLVLASTLGCRIMIAMGAVVLQQRFPTELFWNRFGLTVATRWLVGLIVPAIFIYMAYDCIRRRSTQSATGILYVTCVLIFIGELLALYLTRETGLPF